MWLSTADGDLLLEQVSVDPAYRGKRIGSALIQGVVDRGRAEGFAGVVLTTFRDISWNGPLYRRLGFETMQDAEIGPELRALRRRETEAGLDVLERECLRKRITR
ncbi:GNAT family N-acetyltransferase [Corynebacterium variabile]